MRRFAMTAIAAILFGANVANAETVLRYNNWLPVGHHLEKNVMRPWAAKVKEVTHERVVVEYSTGPLGPLLKSHEMVVSGIADVVLTADSYTPGLFPLAEIVELPFVGSADNEKVSGAYWKVYKEFFEPVHPYSRTKLVTLYSVPPLNVFTLKKSVTQANDMEGMKLRVSGQISKDLISSLGATTISGPISKLAEMVSTGVVDGIVLPDDPAYSFGMARFMKYRTVFPEGGLGGTSIIVLMNKNKWDSISKADQEAIDRISGEVLSRASGRSYNGATEVAIEGFKKAGAKTIEASPELVARAKKAAEPMEQAWIAKAKAKGVDGAAALKRLRELATQ